jgi:ferric iron reductase protein FhuF
MAKDDKEFAKITLQIDAQQLKTIANKGRLEEFIAKATEIFARDLKAELVKESVSSVGTALFLFDDEFGTGPRPPFWHNIARIDALTLRLDVLEQSMLRVSRG